MVNVSARARHHRVVQLPGIYSDTDPLNPLNPSLRFNLNSEIEDSSSCSSSSFVLENCRCLTIRLTEQNNCGTIGLSSLQKTPTDRGRRRARDEDEDPNFGV